MPYTPPSQQSPATSRLTSPPFSRNQSLSKLDTSPPRSPGPRPNPPRSSSSTEYLTRSRRSPSLQSNGSVSSSKAEYAKAISENMQKLGLSINTSTRQSPPPATDGAVPAGMIVSPPDSTQNSSDDDEPTQQEERHVENLAELQAAVRRTLSPHSDQRQPPGDSCSEWSQESQRESPPDEPQDINDPPRLTPQARKISHSRSSTEDSIFHTFNNVSQSDGSDEDEDSANRPPLLRKKSGELVKPAIRPPSRRKHSSMPGTPTFSKAVHFNEDIEQVKHFLQVDRPIAVSAGGSPVEGLEEESEFPFGFKASAASGSDMEIVLANFPRDSLERMSQPVHVEKIWLSDDQKSLLGTIAVANLSFHKLVVARFTFDYWQTTSEVVAEYNNDARQKPRTDGYDQFNFSVKLSDHKNLESKTLLLCVRYQVNGQEYWDNNSSTNYQVEFKKSAKPQTTNPPANTLDARPIPRSRHNSSASHGRPRSMPSFDDFFAGNTEANPFDVRRNANKSFVPDTPPQKKSPSAQPFASRYDFSASLTAALNKAQATLGDRSGLQQSPLTPQVEPDTSSTTSSAAPFTRTGISAPSNSGTESPRPDALLANRQSVDSKAYQEFVNKFCFFGTGKPTGNQSTSSPQPPPTTDGSHDESVSGAPHHSDNTYTHAPSAGYPFPMATGSDKGLSPNQSGYSSPNFSATQGMITPSPVSHGYPYQGSSMFLADYYAQSVSG